MEQLNPKTYLVTGVTSGLGKAIALGLAGTGATVLMVAKDDSHGAVVEREVAQASGNPNVVLLLGDLSNLSSVRNLAEVINSKYEKIDVLIHNNSLYRTQRRVTVDGFEEMFAANYLGPFLLTNLLLDRLRASDAGRILILTNAGARPGDALVLTKPLGTGVLFNANRSGKPIYFASLASARRWCVASAMVTCCRIPKACRSLPRRKKSFARCWAISL